ncbi:hypothetical protein HMPREF2604_05190 [Corynebacterium sp. HMSC055A01]|uniref:hypothetical protein n=1 Tax=Corynebacterium sp. HMSC055A01 TaxID=1715083 RepID=UPI0008A2924D|nr:hypothetical protein [Corynebacterium sp. HMSC055A01]OFN19021.1 hypothetical protein HMPREF2604_05190 [Corynebacterium sp. HMSC055A01]
MTNPTRQEIIDAHKALESLLIAVSGGTSLGPFAITSMSYDIRAALPPKPRPTMADVGWDNEKHRFAVAEHSDYGEVIMLQSDLTTGQVRILLNDYGEFHMPYASPQNLTPTGKRYTLTEVQE